MSNIKSSLIFENYIVELIEFKANYSYSGGDKKIDFYIINDYNFEQNNFVLHLEAVVFPDAEKNDYPFTLKVRIAGVFRIDGNIDESVVKNYIEVNSIAILFPYLRAMISNYTVNANVGNVILPPINVVKYLEEKRKRTGN